MKTYKLSVMALELLVRQKTIHLAHLRTFVPGQRNAQWVEVKQGIQEGESLILHPSDSVNDGVEVNAR